MDALTAVAIESSNGNERTSDMRWGSLKTSNSKFSEWFWNLVASYQYRRQQQTTMGKPTNKCQFENQLGFAFPSTQQVVHGVQQRLQQNCSLTWVQIASKRGSFSSKALELSSQDSWCVLSTVTRPAFSDHPTISSTRSRKPGSIVYGACIACKHEHHKQEQRTAVSQVPVPHCPNFMSKIESHVQQLSLSIYRRRHLPCVRSSRQGHAHW